MPTKRLTAALVEKVKPPKSGRTEYWDTHVKGFGLRVTDKGRKSFVAMTRIGGRKLVRVTLRQPVAGPKYGDCVAKARAEAIEIVEKARRGEDPRHSSRGHDWPDTVKKAAELFLENYVRREGLRSADQIERQFRVDILPVIGDREIDRVSRDDMHMVIDTIAKRTPVGANRVYATLSRFCNWSVSQRYLSVSPLVGMARPFKNEKSRDRVLSRDEIGCLWKIWDAQTYPFGYMAKLLLVTGQRRNEVKLMRWQDVDLEKAIWTIPAAVAKNNEAHIVPLSQLALELLSSVPQVGDYVFTTGRRGSGPVSGFSKVKRATDRATRTDPDDESTAIPGWTWHDMRRTCATGIAELGFPVQVLSKVLNHTDGAAQGITAIYNRFRYEDETRRALEAWSNQLSSIVGVVSENTVEFRR